MTVITTIPPSLRSRIYAHARRCFPAECCGYLTGMTSAAATAMVECRNAHSDGVHPTTPERGEESAFVISGRELIAFARSFDKLVVLLPFEVEVLTVNGMKVYSRKD